MPTPHPGTKDSGPTSKEPCLADPGLARHEKYLGASARRLVPRIEGTAPRCRPSDEAGHQDRRTIAGRAGSRARRGSRPHGRVEIGCLRAWRDTKLTIQHTHACVIHAKRTSSVTTGAVQPHQTAVRRLVKFVVPEQLLPIRDGRLKIASVLCNTGEAIERVDRELLQALTLGERPVVVASAEEIPR